MLGSLDKNLNKPGEKLRDISCVCSQHIFLLQNIIFNSFNPQVRKIFTIIYRTCAAYQEGNRRFIERIELVYY